VFTFYVYFVSNIKETGCEGVDWIHLAQDKPVAGICEHGNEVLVSIKRGGG
jgi:hypothetical protein